MSDETPPVEATPGAELEDRPPVLGSWRNIYAVVLSTLVVLVLVFWAITKVYE